VSLPAAKTWGASAPSTVPPTASVELVFRASVKKANSYHFPARAAHDDVLEVGELAALQGLLKRRVGMGIYPTVGVVQKAFV
jgi:hypothetical protein